MNILEQKRKLLGHHYMGGGGSSGGGSGSNPGDTGRGGGGAHVGEGSGAAPRDGSAPPSGGGGNNAAVAAAAADASRAPVGETARESAPAPAAPADTSSSAAQSEADKTAADNVARERATAVAAAAEAQRAAEAQQAAAASLMGGAVENQSLSPFSDVSLSTNQEANLAKTEQVNALREQANEKLASYYGQDANKYATTADKDPAAVVNVYKDLMGPLTKQTMMLGGGKDKENREVSVDVPQNSFVDAFGRSPTYAEAKALQAAGLGNITGVNANNLTSMNTPVQGVEGLFTNDPGQTADSIVAATDFTDVVGPIAKAASMFIPGMSLAMTIKDLAEGTVTVGDIASNFALGLLAKHFGISAATAKAMINGDFGGALASTMIGQLNPALAKELGVNPALAGIIGKETGAYGAVNKAFSGLNQNWGTTKSIANGFNDALKGIGITTGTGGKDGATGQSINTGFTTQDAIDHYISGGGNGATPAPAPEAPAPAPAPAPAVTPAKTPAKAPTKTSSSLDALGAAAFGLTGALGSSAGSSASTGSTNYGNTASLSSVAPLSLSSSFQTRVIPNQPKFESALEEFQQLQKSDDPNAVQYALSDQAPQGTDMNPYTYGVDRPIEDILNQQAAAEQETGYSPDGIPDYMKTGIQAAKGGAMTGTRYGKYARGGLSTPLMAAGGKMRVDFRHGDAVTGAGDGQSDDIPAMLADGEFVFPADVVAAIGNGSTKAGSDKLYDMMHGIRAHVRSAKPKDLPPEIKSPLDFLKNTKRKRQGAKHG